MTEPMFTLPELLDLKDAVSLFLGEMTGAMSKSDEKTFARLEEKLERLIEEAVE